MAGGFFGGVAEGLEKSAELRDKQELIQLKKAQFQQEQRMKALGFLKDFRPMLEQAVAIEDDKTRSATIADLFAGYQQHFGQAIDKNVITWMQKNPEQAAETLKRTAEEGLRLDQIFPMLGDPMTRGAVMLALEKGKRTRAGQGALAGTTPSAEGTTPSAASTVEPSPLTGPTAPLEAQAQRIEQLISGLDQRISVVAKAGNTQGVAVLEQQRAALQNRLSAIREQPALKGAERGEEVVPLDTIREAAATNSALRAQLRPGMTRSEFDRVTKPVTAAPGAVATPGTAVPIQNPDGTVTTERSITVQDDRLNGGKPTNIPTVWGGKVVSDEEAIANAVKSGVRFQSFNSIDDAVTAAKKRSADLGAGKATSIGGASGTGGIRTPAEVTREKENEQRRAKALPEDLLRDPSVQKAGASTYGELEDAVKSGKVKLDSLPEATRRRINATQAAESAFKDLDSIKKIGESARIQNRFLDVLAGAATRVGTTGPWVTPVRETLNRAGQLIGIQNPGKMSELDLISAITPKLAVQLTQQMKGQQSDREFLAALSTAPSKLNSPAGFAVLLYTTRELNKISMEEDLQARKWSAAHGNLDTPDANGLSFREAFDQSLAAYNKEAGDLSTRVANALKMDPKKLRALNFKNTGR